MTKGISSALGSVHCVTDCQEVGGQTQAETWREVGAGLINRCKIRAESRKVLQAAHQLIDPHRALFSLTPYGCCISSV
jgi:hypothetical protein